MRCYLLMATHDLVKAKEAQKGGRGVAKSHRKEYWLNYWPICVDLPGYSDDKKQTNPYLTGFRYCFPSPHHSGSNSVVWQRWALDLPAQACRGKNESRDKLMLARLWPMEGHPLPDWRLGPPDWATHPSSCWTRAVQAAEIQPPYPRTCCESNHRASFPRERRKPTSCKYGSSLEAGLRWACLSKKLIGEKKKKPSLKRLQQN